MLSLNRYHPMKNLAILTGAGVSAESGIATFRDSNGLWENHRVEDVASPEGKPNVGHKLIAALEDDYNVTVITQNIDDLHERAGSTNIIHLHGELLKARPIDNIGSPQHWPGDIKVGDHDRRGVQLRPHIVWFGESVPEIENAARVVSKADLIIIVGTSMQVSADSVPVIYVDPKPSINYELERRGNIHTIEMGGSAGMEVAREMIPQLVM